MPRKELPDWILKMSQQGAGIFEDIQGTVYCPHCNGYGSSLKDKEGVDRCSFCGGGGRVTKEVAEKYYDLFERSQSKRKEGLRKYYLKRTALFKNKPYNIGIFAKIIEFSGGGMVSLEDVQNGQNDVITFYATPDVVKKIEENLDQLDEFKDSNCIIHEA